MLYPLNPYLLTKQQSAYSSETIKQNEKRMSRRSAPLQWRAHEYSSLCSFVDSLMTQANFCVEALNSFYYSYEIPHIGEEFDLLVLNSNEVINIELKSEPVSEDMMRNQMAKHRHYLSFLNNNVKTFEYISKSETLYMLDHDNSICLVPIGCLCSELMSLRCRYSGNLDELFSAKNYLISPVNNTNAFLNEQYFLTKQQEGFKRKILDLIAKNNKDVQPVFKINGSWGTGKTLLLYDLAKTLGRAKPACIIFCGQSNIHFLEMNSMQNFFEVCPIKQYQDLDYSLYSAVLVDEAQRVRPEQIDYIASKTLKDGVPLVFSLDMEQTIGRRESSNNIDQYLSNKFAQIERMELRNTIRTNKEIASFIKKVFKLKNSNDEAEYKNVKLLSTSCESEAIEILEKFINKGYQFIYGTPSQYNKEWSGEKWTTIDGGLSAHEVIGQEFESVIVVMDEDYLIDNGRLTTRIHPYREYQIDKMMYQAMTRVRDKLAILVFNNLPVLNYLLGIVKLGKCENE